jgi:metal iron transporter
MPHSLYLGSGIVQPRLLEYDRANGHASPAPSPSAATDSYSTKPIYQPSLSAINFCLTYSTVELAISLFTFALFVNSAILIVAGASLYGVDGAEDASLFSIYDLLSHSIAPAAGTIFALALLLSGVSAGIVCTIAGQMVSEGALNWTIAPWLRRLITRSISIVPSIIIAAAIGKDGLTAALNGSQVALSVALPFLSAPLIYFTARNKFMTVPIGPQANPADEDESDDEADAAVETEHRENDSPASGRATAADTTTSTFPNSNSRLDPGAAAVEEGASQPEGVKMRNHWITTTFAVIVWIIITVMNVANLVLLGLGR